MATTPLGPAQQATLGRADPKKIASLFSALPRNWRNGRWLSARNRYTYDSTGKISEDLAGALGTSVGTLNHTDMANYIAASSGIHCMDGWGYLSQAMEASLCGNSGVAKHLAYYAELRGTMSLLASAGIGVFLDKNFVVKSDKTCDRINGRTHAFTWAALEHWATLGMAHDLLFRVIRPGGLPLADWLSHFPLSAGITTRGILAERWLQKWGLDLRRFADDHDARNNASYRPSDIGDPNWSSASDNLEFVTAFWRSHEPSLTNPFKIIDRYLLRKSVAFLFKETHANGRTRLQAKKQYGAFIKPMLHAMLPTNGDFNDGQWEDFLNFSFLPEDNKLLKYAEGTDAPSSPLHHLQVIARATLILRLASGATKELIGNLTDEERELLSFWWNPIGENRGLWETGNAPASFLDLWGDADESLTRLQAWRDGGGASRSSMFASSSKDVHSLSSCERVAMWSFGL
jgi:hypothetical protein